MRERHQAYDLIGDIHGHAKPLRVLLEKMGYSERNGVYSHPKRKVIFLGDYIDRGPSIRETLSIVKGMVDAKNALAIMGNHEFNALAYHTEDGRGGYTGVVSEVKETRSSVLVDLDGNWPNQSMTLYVPLAAARNWHSVHPNGWPKCGDTISATGPITLFRGRPEIVIKDPAQVTW